MPQDVLKLLPISIKELILNGTYTLYKSKEDRDLFFIEMEYRKGVTIDKDGNFFDDKDLDLNEFIKIDSYIVPDFHKKVVNE